MKRFSPAPAEARPLQYWFAGLRFEADGTLLRGETPLELTEKEAAVLRVLLDRAGEIVSPAELKRGVWATEHATSDSVAQCMASLRERLHPADCIESVYKRGYRVAAPVRAVDPQPVGEPVRLAILPFVGGYGVPEYLGPAIAAQAAGDLKRTRLARADMVALDSVFTLARRGYEAREIGATLGAGIVLGGVLRATPERYRLRAEMIRVEDGAELWAEEMMAERGRIIELEADLVERVGSRMEADGLSIAAAEAGAGEISENHREAHELYLRAHHEWQSLERHRMQDAMGHLQWALELDPNLMAARIDLTHLCVMQAIYGFMPPTTAAGMIRRAVGQAAESAENAEALLPALGWIYFHVDRNLPAALDAFARSAHLAHDPWITRVRAMFLLSRHRFSEAIELLRAAIEIDPYSPWLHERLAWALHLAGEREASVEQIRKAIGQFADHDGALLYGAVILAYNGEAERGAELARALAARSAHFDLAMAVHAYALARAGRAEEARALLEQLEWLSRERFVMRTFQAAAYAALGEADRALEELTIANEDRCPWFFQMLADPRVEGLRGRAEFEKMRAQLAAMEHSAEKNSRL